MSEVNPQVRVFKVLESCEDCAFLFANGDIPEDRPDLPELVCAKWPPAEGYHLCLGNNADGPDEFSWRPCESCGSRLGGSRYYVDVLVHRGTVAYARA